MAQQGGHSDFLLHALGTDLSVLPAVARDAHNGQSRNNKNAKRSQLRYPRTVLHAQGVHHIVPADRWFNPLPEPTSQYDGQWNGQ